MAPWRIIKLWITGSRVPFEVEAIGPITFQEVKEKIENAVGVEQHRQTLYYHQVRMDDVYRVREVVYEYFAEIELMVAPLPRDAIVTVLCKLPIRDVEAVSIRETDSVQNLRTKLSTLWRLPIKTISLSRFGCHMDDDFPLSDYYVCEGSLVNVAVNPIPPASSPTYCLD